MKIDFSLFVIVIVILLTLVTASTSLAIVKCIGPGGDVIYANSACPKGYIAAKSFHKNKRTSREINTPLAQKNDLHRDDDKKDGQVTLYYENGKVSYRGRYKNGKMHGRGTLYYKNGRVGYKGQYKNGKMHGQGTWYQESGKMGYKGQYKNGKMHGQWL